MPIQIRVDVTAFDVALAEAERLVGQAAHPPPELCDAVVEDIRGAVTFKHEPDPTMRAPDMTVRVEVAEGYRERIATLCTGQGDPDVPLNPG